MQNCRELATPGGKAPHRGAPNQQQQQLQQELHRQEPVNNGNPNNKTTRNPIRKTTQKLGDVPPITGVSLIVGMITIIVVAVAGGSPWVIVTLAMVVLVLVSRLR